MGANHLLFGLCIEIITLVIVLHFLAKVKKDQLGKGLKWAGNILLILGFLAIACTLTRGIVGMMHCGRCAGQNECPMDGGHWGHERGGMMMHDGCDMHGGMMMHDGNGCDMNGGGMMMHDGKCCMDSANAKKCPMDGKGMGKNGMNKDSMKAMPK